MGVHLVIARQRRDVDLCGFLAPLLTSSAHHRWYRAENCSWNLDVHSGGLERVGAGREEDPRRWHDRCKPRRTRIACVTSSGACRRRDTAYERTLGFGYVGPSSSRASSVSIVTHCWSRSRACFTSSSLSQRTHCRNFARAYKASSIHECQASAPTFLCCERKNRYFHTRS